MAMSSGSTPAEGVSLAEEATSSTTLYGSSAQIEGSTSGFF